MQNIVNINVQFSGILFIGILSIRSVSIAFFFIGNWFLKTKSQKLTSLCWNQLFENPKQKRESIPERSSCNSTSSTYWKGHFWAANDHLLWYHCDDKHSIKRRLPIWTLRFYSNRTNSYKYSYKSCILVHPTYLSLTYKSSEWSFTPWNLL